MSPIWLTSLSLSDCGYGILRLNATRNGFSAHSLRRAYPNHCKGSNCLTSCSEVSNHLMNLKAVSVEGLCLFIYLFIFLL